MGLRERCAAAGGEWLCLGCVGVCLGAGEGGRGQFGIFGGAGGGFDRQVAQLEVSGCGLWVVCFGGGGSLAICHPPNTPSLSPFRHHQLLLTRVVPAGCASPSPAPPLALSQHTLTCPCCRPTLFLLTAFSPLPRLPTPTHHWPCTQLVRSLTVCRALVVPRPAYAALAADFPMSATAILVALQKNAERVSRRLGGLKSESSYGRSEE